MAISGKVDNVLQHEPVKTVPKGVIQTDEWWQDVTIPMLESVRRRLRNLVQLIERSKRKPIYTDFEDEIGPTTEIEFFGLSSGDNFEKFLSKARAFLREHEDNLTIRKLRANLALTESDLEELDCPRVRRRR